MQIFRTKELNLQRDRIFLSVVAIFVSLYIAFSCTYFVSAAESVRDDVVRLHILANSDSSADQAVKLQVRDALLETNAALLSGAVNAENAYEYFEQSKNELLNTARRVLRENGFYYDVKISLEKEYYETRKYDSLTFPAGEYMSLKVILGDGEGHNWWCVMFPPLCVPAAGEVIADEDSTDYLSQSGERLINSGEKYVVKFKLLELYEELKNKIG